jgi:hypothetical protein
MNCRFLFLREPELAAIRLICPHNGLAESRSGRAAQTYIFAKQITTDLLKLKILLLLQSLSCQRSDGQRQLGPPREHWELIYRILHSGTFLASPDNCPSSSCSSRFESQTNTQVQGDQRPQQVLCRLRPSISLPRGVAGQDLAAPVQKMNC